MANTHPKTLFGVLSSLKLLMALIIQKEAVNNNIRIAVHKSYQAKIIGAIAIGSVTYFSRHQD